MHQSEAVVKLQGAQEVHGNWDMKLELRQTGQEKT